MKRWSLLLGALMLGHAFSVSANTDYPNRPVRIVVPFAPGGGGDFIVRTWSERLAQVLKQPVVVENRGGAGTVTGTEYVARAAPDGYTLLFTSTALATNPTLIPGLRYRTPEDFAPVGLVITYPFVLAARSDFPHNTVPELIAFASKNPDKVSISNSGEGSGSALAATLFREATGVQMLTVSYKGAGPAIADVAAGHVDLTFTGMSQVKPFLDGKKVKVLGTSGLNRMASAKQVKTIAEQGVPGFNSVVWWGMLAPAGTPKDVIAKLNAALKTTLADPAIVERLAVIDGEVEVSTPDAFEKLIRDELTRWGRLLKPTDAAKR